MKKINFFIKTHTNNTKNILVETILPFYKPAIQKKHLYEYKSPLNFFPYTQQKNKAHIYKIIFLIISGIFSSLALYMHYSYLNWTCFLILGDNTSIKNLLSFISLFLAISSFFFGIYIHPIREVLGNISKKILIKAKKYKEKLLKELDSTNINFIEYQKEKKLIVQSFEELKESIVELKNSSSLVLKKISISEELNDDEKEDLCNQEILNFEKKLNELVEKYRQSMY